MIMCLLDLDWLLSTFRSCALLLILIEKVSGDADTFLGENEYMVSLTETNFYTIF